MTPEQHDIFLKIQHKLYRYAISLSRDTDEAKDIFQQTSMKIWELRNEWSTWNNFEAYAMRMVRNTFFNHVNKSKRHQFVGIEEYQEPLVKNETEAKYDLISLKLMFQRLVSKLPDVQKEVLYLREIESYEYKDIGQILNLSEAQVKVYLYRGRQHIKSKVKSK